MPSSVPRSLCCLQLSAAAIDPLARVLRVTPLEPRDWLVIVTLAAVPAVVGQMLKAVRGRRELSAFSF
jgi:hypothetical protein